MKKFLFSLTLILVLAFSLFPAVSNAAGLVPCGGTGQDMCTLCHLIVGIQGIITFGFKIMVIIGIIMLVAAGILYIVSAGNEGMMETAKSLIKNALIGFTLILTAWLIVTTTMWIMGTKEKSDSAGGGVLGIGIEGWNTFTCNTKTKAKTSSSTSDTSDKTAADKTAADKAAADAETTSEESKRCGNADEGVCSAKPCQELGAGYGYVTYGTCAKAEPYCCKLFK